MKNLLGIIIFLLLVSCSNAPSEKAIQIAIVETQTAQPSNTPPPLPTATMTQAATATSTAIPTETQTPTATITPFSTATPTEDLSFYNIAECLPKNTLVEKGTVVEAIDGDNIRVLFDDGRTENVRYIGIDAPERERPFFTESTSANSSLVNQLEVILIKDVSDKDQYGRLLRYAVVDNVFVNLELVRMGFAKAEKYPPDVACADTLATADGEARAAQLGMWIVTPTPESTIVQVIILEVNKRDEWVDIRNTGNSDVDLAGWRLLSERGNQDCYLSGVIAAGEILRVWSGTAQGEGYSCGYDSPIWNNSESDPAVLYNAQGVEVSRK